VRKTGILLIAMTAVCLADAGVLDYVEPILGTPVVATSMGYVTGVLTERGWTQIEIEGERVSAVYVGDGRDERLAFTLTPAPPVPDEPSEASYTPGKIHQDLLTVEYSRVPWLEIAGAVEVSKAEFDRLAEAFDYLVGPGITEKNDETWSHTWPDRDLSRLELILTPVWDTKLVASVQLVPLRVPEGD
jgi:hypothetical protein